MKLFSWLNARFPFQAIWKKHAANYYVPKNLNFWYFFGVFSLIVLMNQIVTGIWLAMVYTPTSADAFSSIEHIMRDVPFGWLLRYLHAVGASAFFIVIYLHMYRSIMYGSFKAPRELLWIIGMILYVILLMESASGYVLPWGQMSFWAIKVLITVFSVIPLIGKQLVILLQGDYNVSGVTLHRFFAFHVIAIPLLILLLVWMHIIALHQVGSNNPTGKDNIEKIPFHPYYTVKDFAGVVVFLFLFFFIVFFAPTLHGYFLENANFLPANPLVTPLHISPPWYLAPYYSILRAIPNKLMGISLAAGAIILLFLLPWLDRSKVRSIRYRGKYSKIALTIFIISFVGLGFLGTDSLTDTNILFSRIFTIFYYLFFLLMPIYSKEVGVGV
ncbi:MAG: cytochrome B [Gammaproteobacteria bacterium RIFCSPHIGHO2_02_FULL_39_13]|nr:MAG: cytochrome B [Gammaproteobacteria bacterium RIFCSPHIGHO2_02_FULL_39_13]OGT50550.1 MAG: cytochrome B [Gammaproteobacteria bacterium RIFCSPHIGHO2_12_FULL_39_24]